MTERNGTLRFKRPGGACEPSRPKRWALPWLAVVLPVALASEASAERIKDIADVKGARSNQLVGYGLVVGLPGTGDDSFGTFNVQSVVTMLKQLGTYVDPNRVLRLRNVAAVLVTSELPPYVGAGQKLDVTVSSIGNALSLEGGTLIVTPLKGADGKVYAVAQGPLSVGGFSAFGRTGSYIARNTTTVGRVPNGALVEREVPATLPTDNMIITLRSPDFTTAVRLARAISDYLQSKQPPAPTSGDGATPGGEGPEGTPGTEASSSESANEGAQSDPSAPATASGPPVDLAMAQNAGQVAVSIPEAYRARTAELIAEIEGLEVTPDLVTRVVVNERTGTVVLGESVILRPVAIAHGGLTLEVSESFGVSQPNPAFLGNSGGQTVITPQSRIRAQVDQGQLKEAGGAALGDVVRALNALGVTPRDMVAILQALKTAGALRAELVIQ